MSFFPLHVLRIPAFYYSQVLLTETLLIASVSKCDFYVFQVHVAG